MSQLGSSKRRRISPSHEDAATATHNFYANASKWNLEEAYEKRAKKQKKKDKQSSKLPIKQDGAVKQLAPDVDSEGDDERIKELGQEAPEEAGEEAEVEDASTQQEAVEEKPVKEQILEAKEELARLAGLISEDPEENIGNLKSLAKIAAAKNVTIKKLALATQLAVFKDIIPGYRIRALSEEDMKARLSKDVKRVRNFEQTLVVCYRDYVHGLARIAKVSSQREPTPAQTTMGSTAFVCACALLTSVPHFNFRGELLNIVVNKLANRKIDQDGQRCAEALETLFENDEDGKASLEAVSLMTKMFKSKDYNIHELALNSFLQLRLLSEYSYRASTQRVDKAQDDEPQLKLKKKHREFRTKKQRKMLREQKTIQKEMNEADAAVSHEERDKNQSEMLKMVFVAYFRILKLRKQNLMGAVLEGLARYAHLINQDFFGDILESLRDLMSSNAIDDDDVLSITDAEQRDMSREALLCTVTAFALLQGQDVAKSASTLHLDLSFFTKQLYNAVMPLSLDPSTETAKQATASSKQEETPKSKRKINVQTPSLLLLRSLTSLLLPPQQARSVPPTLLAAFIKRLMTAALHLPERSAVALLGLVKQVVKVHGNKVVGMWYSEEVRGDGVYDMEREEWGSANPFATVVWEGVALRVHWSERVRDAAKEVEEAVLSRRT